MTAVQRPRGLWGWVMLLGLLAGCPDREMPAVPGHHATTAAHAPRLDVAKLGLDRGVTLKALGMPHHRVAELLGAHQVHCRSDLTTQVPSYPEHRVQQELTLRMDKQGHFSVNKTTDPQYGQEVIWTGEWLYPRLRHSLFLRRKPRTGGEPQQIADRLYGLLPAYVELLGRFIEVKRVGTARHAGREGIKISLALAAKPLPPPRYRGRAKRWREGVSARSIEGQAILCARTGAPLKVELKASWRFHPPKGGETRSGIPASLDTGTVGQSKLSFSQSITAVGDAIVIKAPEDDKVKKNVRRVRLEIERQMLAGERPVTGRVDGDDEDEDDGE